MYYGVIIRDLFLYSVGRYSKESKIDKLKEIKDKLGLNSISSVESFVKKCKKVYPSKLIVDQEASVTYAKNLSPEFDKRYYYHAYNNGSFYGKMYQSRLEELEEKGLVNAKWKSEYGVYLLVKENYPDAEYQYRAPWLNLLTLDVYIPSIKVGIEYQGQQHYEESTYFGGKEGLEEQQQRDSEKREKCQDNGVSLIEWKYDIPVTRESYRKEILPLLLPFNKGCSRS